MESGATQCTLTSWITQNETETRSSDSSKIQLKVFFLIYNCSTFQFNIYDFTPAIIN